MHRFVPHAGVVQRLKGVTVCTVGSEPWRGSLSDRAIQLPRSCRPLQNVRLSSDVPNPLRRSPNSWADGDGCVGLHLMQVSRAAAGSTVWTVCTVRSEPWRGSLSDRLLIAESRCAVFFVPPVSPARRNQDRSCMGARCRSCHRFTRPDTWTRPPVSRVK
jgi:hypothetical protein